MLPERCFSTSSASRPFQVIFLTDGRPTIGETRPDKILQRLASVTDKTSGLVRIFSFGIGIVALLLIIEHLLVRDPDTGKINMAFFTVNGVISLLLGVLGIVDVIRSV